MVTIRVRMRIVIPRARVRVAVLSAVQCCANCSLCLMTDSYYSLGRCRGLPTSNRVLLLVYYRILEFHEFSPKYASKILREPIRSGIYSSRSNRLISRFVDMRYLPGTLADRPDFTDPACRSTKKAIRSRTPCFFSTGQFDRHSLFPGTCTYADQMLLLFQG